MKTSFSIHESFSSNLMYEGFKLCPACGDFSPRSQDQITCVVCGTRLIEECPLCLEPILYPAGRFCTMCGVRFEFGDDDAGEVEVDNEGFDNIVLG